MLSKKNNFQGEQDEAEKHQRGGKKALDGQLLLDNVTVRCVLYWPAFYPAVGRRQSHGSGPRCHVSVTCDRRFLVGAKLQLYQLQFQLCVFPLQMFHDALF